MDPILQNTMLPSSKFVDASGGVDVRGFCEAIELDQSAVAKVLEIPRQTVSVQFRSERRFVRLRDERAREFWHKLDRVYSLLLAVTDEDRSQEEIRAWLKAPNKGLRMERPIDLILRREVDPLIKKLTDVVMAAHGG